MSGWIRFLLGLALGLVIAFVPRVLHHLQGVRGVSSSARAHTAERFSFVANAPFAEVFPLFGADRERVWSPGWNPRFVHPMPAADVPGMVFTVTHSHFEAVWINTAFDPQNGRAQYVYTIPDHLVTLITVNAAPEGNQTRVVVEYDRTALVPEADSHVLVMAQQDHNAGPEWEAQINHHLATRQSR